MFDHRLHSPGYAVLNEILIFILTPLVQPYAGLLPPRVLEPGKAVGTITDQMAELTGLPKACTVCAGTSGLQCSLRILLPCVQQLSLSSFGCMLLMTCWSLRLLLHSSKIVLYGTMLGHRYVALLAPILLASQPSFCEQSKLLLPYEQQLPLSGVPLAEFSCWNPILDALHLPFSC